MALELRRPGPSPIPRAPRDLPRARRAAARGTALPLPELQPRGLPRVDPDTRGPRRQDMTGCHEIPRGKLRPTWGPATAGGRSMQHRPPATAEGNTMRCERLEPEPRINGDSRARQCDAAAKIRVRSAAETTIGNFCRRHAGEVLMHRGWTQEPL